MARRRRKSSSWKTFPLWCISLALIGWGLWQAEMLRRALVAQGTAVTLQPGMAIGPDDAAPPGPDTRGSSSPAPAPPGVTLVGVTLSDLTAALPPAHPDVTAPMQPSPTFDAALSPDDLLARGAALLDAGQIPAGRFALNEALARTTDEARAAALRQQLAAINLPVFLGTTVLPDDPAVRIVPIQDGDTFISLGRAYGLPAAFLQKLNPKLDERNLRPRTGIKIVQGPFHSRIIKHAGRLDLYARDLYVASCLVDFPEGNFLPRGDYQVSPGTKLQLGFDAAPNTWIGFQGLEPATESVTNGWMFGAAGPRGNTPRDRATGIHLADGDLVQLYNVLSEGRSRLRVEP
jgi:hypothetical protein